MRGSILSGVALSTFTAACFGGTVESPNRSFPNIDESCLQTLDDTGTIIGRSCINQVLEVLEVPPSIEANGYASIVDGELQVIVDKDTAAAILQRENR